MDFQHERGVRESCDRMTDILGSEPGEIALCDREHRLIFNAGIRMKAGVGTVMCALPPSANL
jgi:hypothetical protein